jgi:hypothetical protein
VLLSVGEDAGANLVVVGMGSSKVAWVLHANWPMVWISMCLYFCAILRIAGSVARFCRRALHNMCWPRRLG